jgi:hypothetical protein
MKNNKLAIAIPTYNRAAILRENILLMLGEIRRFSIPVYISDDSTNNETEIVFQEIKKVYEYIYYYKNSPSLGHDKNCLRTLCLPSEDYTWYLGDSMIIKKEGVSKILDIIKFGNYSFISVNCNNRKLDLPTSVFENKNSLLVDLGWHFTMTGATIYSRQEINLLENFEISKYKNFPQTAILFEQFAIGRKNIYWLNERLIYGNKNKKSYWSTNVFNVFLIDWEAAISNLPNIYTLQNKNKMLIKHSKQTGLFNFFSMINYRSKSFFNLKILNEHYVLIKKHSSVPVFFLLLISIFPVKILSFVKKWMKCFIK